MIASTTRVRVLTLGLALGVLATMATGATAQTAHPGLVSVIPSASTPHLFADTTVSAPAVYSFAQYGGTMYAGGNFHAVQNPARTATYTRTHLFSFSGSTGAVSTMAT
ncbi:MAG: hypothetical protein M3O55_00195, partial [Actinomycetota bacterium]|nr:hypothetical protein [Actinomycetota bacterium]